MRTSSTTKTRSAAGKQDVRTAPALVSRLGLRPDELRQTYNSLIHGDHKSALTSAVLLPDGTAGYTSSKDLTSPARADDISRQASTYAMVLTVRCA